MLGRRFRFFILILAVLCFAPVLADESGTDSLSETVESDGTTDVSDEDIAVMENEDDQKIVQYESFMLEMGWDEGDDYRKEIFEKISELKEALKQNLQELSDNAQAMKENEQSFENRMLGGLTMAATGIGGMELAQGLAEQKADEAAERDMTAYLATFQCKVGDQRYSGGTMGIETPGANQLTSLYQEYVELAANLKERKAALGMKAGIESEVILDKNNMGLYDDVGHGIENGTYASLYRASRGNENDIKKLEEQKNTSATRVKGGAIAAAAGAVAGMVGNQIINHDKHDKSAEILAKREDIKQQLADVMQFEVDNCNAKIRDAKEWASEQKRTKEYEQNQGLRDWVSDIDKLEFIDDLTEIRDHPICN